MVGRSRATKITAEKAIFMLNTSASGSNFQGYESDGILDGSRQCEDKKEASCADNGSTSVGADQTPVDSQLICIDDGASTSRQDSLDSPGQADADPGVSFSQAGDPSNLTFAVGGANTSSQGYINSGGADRETALGQLLVLHPKAASTLEKPMKIFILGQLLV